MLLEISSAILRPFWPGRDELNTMPFWFFGVNTDFLFNIELYYAAMYHESSAHAPISFSIAAFIIFRRQSSSLATTFLPKCYITATASVLFLRVVCLFVASILILIEWNITNGSFCTTAVLMPQQWFLLPVPRGKVNNRNEFFYVRAVGRLSGMYLQSPKAPRLCGVMILLSRGEFGREKSKISYQRGVPEPFAICQIYNIIWLFYSTFFIFRNNRCERSYFVFNLSSFARNRECETEVCVFGVFSGNNCLKNKTSIYANHICSTFTDKYYSNLLPSHLVCIDSQLEHNKSTSSINARFYADTAFLCKTFIKSDRCHYRYKCVMKIW